MYIIRMTVASVVANIIFIGAHTRPFFFAARMRKVPPPPSGRRNLSHARPVDARTAPRTLEFVLRSGHGSRQRIGARAPHEKGFSTLENKRLNCNDTYSKLKPLFEFHETTAVCDRSFVFLWDVLCLTTETDTEGTHDVSSIVRRVDVDLSRDERNIALRSPANITHTTPHGVFAAAAEPITISIHLYATRPVAVRVIRSIACVFQFNTVSHYSF